MNSRNIYLDNVSLDEAIEKYYLKAKESFKRDIIQISAKNSLGYILSEPVFAKVSSPNFTASAMDGIAVDYAKTLQATDFEHVTLVKDVDYMVVDTGDYIPPNFNAVIMVENLINVDENHVKITSPIGFFENIRSPGEDIVDTQMILPTNHKIRAVDIGALITGGIEYLNVYKPLTFGIQPTGTEIVDVSKGMFEKGDIIDSNSYMLKALVEEMGFVGNTNSIQIDDYNLLKQNISKLVDENDVILINAGSSAGREDFTKDILAEIGEVVIHGVAIKPGKPVILAIVRGKIVIGIPGYPVACYMVFEKLIKPVILKLLNQYNNEYYIEATLSKRLNSSFKHLEFVRVTLGFVNGKWVATPLSRGSGVSMSLVDCDGVLEVPKEIEGYNNGEIVNVKLNKPLEMIKNRVVSIGSHDLILDLLKNDLVEQESPIKFSSTHQGSFGGIISLLNKECHIAPIHVLDENTGVYNIEVVKKYFKNEKMALIKGVKRKQGLIVQKGNPKNISNITDIKNHNYVNRQNGSGTYILLEYLLKQNNIKKDDITGFNLNVPTHFDVAINVKEGVADCGLGIFSVAKTLDLDFVYVTDEDYDFLVYEKELETEQIKEFIKALKSDKLVSDINNLGGYSTENIGEVVHID